MKRLNYYIATLLACGAVLVGCSDDSIEEVKFEKESNQDETIGDVLFNFTVAPIRNVVPEGYTRAVEPESCNAVDVCLMPDTAEPEATRVGTIDETTIADMWVCQFSYNDDHLLVKPQYLSGNVKSIRIDKQCKSKIYFIANTHDSSLFANVTSPDDIINAKRSVSSESELLNGGNTLPMAGYFEGYVESMNSVTLRATVARLQITLNYTADSQHTTPQKVSICNVPGQTAWWFPEDMTTPSATAKTSAESYVAEWASFTPTPQSINCCYIPVNMQGINTSVPSAEYKTTSYAKNATYINVACTFRHYLVAPLMDSTVGMINFVYADFTYCLGCNTTTDYNVCAGSSYGLQFSLQSTDPFVCQDSRLGNKRIDISGMYEILTTDSNYPYTFYPMGTTVVSNSFANGTWQICKAKCDAIKSNWGYTGKMFNPAMVGYETIVKQMAAMNTDWYNDLNNSDQGFHLHLWYPDSSAANSWKYRNFQMINNVLFTKESSGSTARTVCLIEYPITVTQVG